MSRPVPPKVITANDLLMGDVVYLGPDDAWHRDLARACVLRDADEAQHRLSLAQQRVGEVVGVYLAEVRLTATGPEPLHFREAFRATGPSNYPHGKQADSAL